MGNLLIAGMHIPDESTTRNFYIEEATLNNENTFTSIGSDGNFREYIKPVGVLRSSSSTTHSYSINALNPTSSSSLNIYSVKTNGQDAWSKYGWGTYDTSATSTTSVENTFTFYSIIPWFNNDTDASLWSRGLPCNEDNWIGGLPIRPPYNWISVPSVSGKNGILSLAQIASESINDGEPVSDAAATAFSDLPAECNVGEIIDELLPYEESLVDVLVKYKVKSSIAGAFSMLKLVAKAGKIPKSVDDGDVSVNINANKKSKLVTGLDEGTTYYFVIFAEDSAGSTAQSEPKKIKTGSIPPSEGKWEETVSSSKALIDEFSMEFEETVTYEQIT